MIPKNVRINKVSFNPNTLIAFLSDGEEVSIPLDLFPKIQMATEEQRGSWKLWSHGDSIYWDRLDVVIFSTVFNCFRLPEYDVSLFEDKDNILRTLLYVIYRAKCVYCRKVYKLKDTVVEHIIPHSKGGCDNLLNLTLACKYCNGYKSDRFGPFYGAIPIICEEACEKARLIKKIYDKIMMEFQLQEKEEEFIRRKAMFFLIILQQKTMVQGYRQN